MVGFRRKRLRWEDRSIHNKSIQQEHLITFHKTQHENFQFILHLYTDPVRCVLQEVLILCFMKRFQEA